jgi:hypothetical protein
MFRPFLPHTAAGRIAGVLSIASVVVFLALGAVPALLQAVFGYAAIENGPGLTELPTWWSGYVGPIFSVSVLVLCMVSGIWAIYAKFVKKDRGSALWLAMLPMVLVVILLIGEFAIPPRD